MLVIRTIFVSLIGALFVTFVIIVGTSTHTERREMLRLPDNHIVMENVTLVHNANKLGGYSLMTAETAYFDRNAEVLVMTDFSVNHDDGKLSFTSQGNRGEYTLNTKLIASGELSGHYNDVEYSSGAGGLLLYDFTSLQGSMSGEDVRFTDNASLIRADKVIYDGTRNYTSFEGDVELSMSGTK
jgi:hypothetical protein